jgi:hypothetical protein
LSFTARPRFSVQSRLEISPRRCLETRGKFISSTNSHLDCWLTAKADFTLWLQNVGKHYGKLSENSRKQWCVRMLTFHVRLLHFLLLANLKQHTHTTIIAHNDRAKRKLISCSLLCAQHAFARSLVEKNFARSFNNLHKKFMVNICRLLLNSTSLY